MPKPLLICLTSAVIVGGCTGQPSGNTPAQATHPTTMMRAAQASPAKCPAAQFPAFLQAFAGDPKIQRYYTAPVLDVVDWVNADEPQMGTRVVHVPRDEYHEFKLRYHAGQFQHVEDPASPEPIAVQPRVTPGPNGYRVEYIFNMSEGNSWTFARRGDCWQLTGEPDPSLL